MTEVAAHVIGWIVSLLLGIAALAVFAKQWGEHTQEHFDRTGVPAPTTKTLRYLRSRARKKGITEQQAYEEWLGRKQKAAARAPSPGKTKDTPENTTLSISFNGVREGKANFSFHCRDCGGHLLHTEDDPPTPSSLVTCKACGRFLGRLGEIKERAQRIAQDAGVPATGAETWTAHG